MTLSRAKPLGWVARDQLTATQANAIDVNAASGIDGTGGGTYTPTTQIIINGDGLDCDTPPRMCLMNWQRSVTSATDAMDDGCYRAGSWFVVGGTDLCLRSDNDGLTWTADDPGTVAPTTVASDETSVTIYGGASATSRRRVGAAAATSVVLPGTPSDINTIRFVTGSTFVACGQKAGPLSYFASTTDAGVSWTQRTGPASFAAMIMQSMAASSTGIVVAAASATSHTKLAVSVDSGVTWADSTTSLTNDSYIVGYNATRAEFMAIGVLLNVYTSTDGLTWTAKTDLPVGTAQLLGQEYHNIASCGSAWVVGGTTATANSSPCVLYSLDGGATWATQYVGTIGQNMNFCVSDISGKKALMGSGTGIFHSMRRTAP